MEVRASDHWIPWGHRVNVPLLIALALALVYGVEIYLAGSLRSGAAYSLITGMPAEFDPLIQVMGPFLHSNHEHIGWNLAWFVPLSWILLTHVELAEYLGIFLTVSWFTGSIAPWILAGGPNFGISGANAALAGWGVLVVLNAMIDSAAEMDSWRSPTYWSYTLQLVIPAVLTVRMIGQSIGVLSASSGASLFGHLFGAVFGLAYGVYWIARRRGKL